MKRSRIAFVLAMFLLLAAALLVFHSLSNSPVPASIFPNERITVAGTVRHYRLVVPKALSTPAPLIFAFHGIGDSPQSMSGYSQLDQFAADHGCILVYPAARRSMLATMKIDARDLSSNPDIRFFDKLLAHLLERFNIDSNRVYLVGMSNGATFAQLLAYARPEKIAAVVAHSGSKPRELETLPGAMPMLLLAGQEDPVATAMKSDAKNYRTNGHVVEFIAIPELGHEWSVSHNARIWQFLSKHSLSSRNSFNLSPSTPSHAHGAS